MAEYTEDLCEGGSSFGDQFPGREHSKLFDNLNTDYRTDCWLSSSSYPMEVGYDFGAGNEKKIEQVKIYATNRLTKVPYDFIIQGSNDNTNWTDLYTVADESWSEVFESKTYQFTNSMAYRYIRLYITEGAHGECELGEMEMMEKLITEINPDRPDLVTKLYNLSSKKGNLRGKAKAGFVRPTISQFFTSKNFSEIPTQEGDEYTKLLLHMEGDDNGNIFEDSSSGSHPVTVLNDTKTVSEQKKFGNTSAKFDGDSDVLVIPNHDDFNFGTENFTIDFWVMFKNRDRQAWVGKHSYYGENILNRSWFVFYNGEQINFRVWAPNASYDILIYQHSPWSPDLYTWYHIAAVANETTGFVFLDGVLMESDERNYGEVNTITRDVEIGVDSGYRYYFNGYMDELRISKGIARWTENFTPPTKAY